jgi:hypothetical protein
MGRRRDKLHTFLGNKQKLVATFTTTAALTRRKGLRQPGWVTARVSLEDFEDYRHPLSLPIIDSQLLGRPVRGLVINRLWHPSSRFPHKIAKLFHLPPHTVRLGMSGLAVQLFNDIHR